MFPHYFLVTIGQGSPRIFPSCGATDKINVFKFLISKWVACIP